MRGLSARQAAATAGLARQQSPTQNGNVRQPLCSKGGTLTAQLVTLSRESLACGECGGVTRGVGTDLTGHRRAPNGWPPTAVAVVLGGSAVLLVDGVYWALLASMLHLPPSAVPLVSDYRFCRSAQRLARLT